MAVKGIDVASYQSPTFSTAGLAFVFVKATEGTGYTNPKMTAQAKHARDAGLVVGFYHFLRPGSMKAQAAYFVAKAASRPGDPLFADWEDSGVSSAEKDQFLAEVKRLRGADHRVGLYCNQSFWITREHGGNAGDALWIADYVTAGRPRIQAKWLFHQHTDKPLDTNVAAFPDKAALRAWATKTTTTPPPAPPVKTPQKETPSVATNTELLEDLTGNLLRIGSLTEKDAKGKPVPHGAGYYLAHVEQDTSALRADVAGLKTAVAELTALVKALKS